MFRKVLIANRGEIAIRIIRTCRELGYSAVAVYSEADAESLHVRMADEAVCVGPASSNQSYSEDRSHRRGSKNQQRRSDSSGLRLSCRECRFARAVVAAGLTSLVHRPKQWRSWDRKRVRVVPRLKPGVPIVPGTVEPLVSFAEANATAEKFGYPVMLKAAAGGGGKGMRLVDRQSDLRSAFETAQTEAAAAFGDSSLYLEKAVERPRHIEIQIFGDTAWQPRPSRRT